MIGKADRTRCGPPRAGVGVPIAEVPGYAEVDPRSYLREEVDGDPGAVAVDAGEQILRALRARNVVAVLAKSGEQLLRETVPGRTGPGPSGLEQAHVELLQAFALAAGPGRPVPASPNSMVRLWRLVGRRLAAHAAASAKASDEDSGSSHRVRLRTMFYRNAFNGEDAMDVVPALLAHMDAVARRELGYTASKFAKALYAVANEALERFRDRILRERILRGPGDAGQAADDVFNADRMARRAWQLGRAHVPNEARGSAAFQIAEMLCAPLFTFRRADLAARFGEPVAAALFACAIPLGGLTAAELGSAHLNNPVWRRPFVALDADTLLLPVPALAVSFPFAIVEGLIEGRPRSQQAYSAARARFLEDDVERIVREALPSASVHRAVRWTDPETGRTFENDVVAIVGTHVLVFEAKSGKLAAAARRGGAKSLRRNLQELFIEPGEQASRLEELLAKRDGKVELVDHRGEVVRVDPSRPSVVFKFSVCLEQFASVTSGRRLFQELGLLDNNRKWAPVFTLGELRMLARHLDTEISFLHYLSRRATIDDDLDFVADEQDLLAMYLSNGFAFDADALRGRKVVLVDADAPVRGRKVPRGDRREFATPGVSLPPLWRAIAEEILRSPEERRFDIVVSIMNQSPGALVEMDRVVRRWRSGAGRGRGDTVVSRSAVSDRVVIVALVMAGQHAADLADWANRSRTIARNMAAESSATDCVVILKRRRSPRPTYDALGFFRFARGDNRSEDGLSTPRTA